MTTIDEDFNEEEEEIEAYCVNCRETVVMESPQPVWTKRGAPGTRGTCPVCGNTTFRMGHTPAHDLKGRPEVNGILDLTRKQGMGAVSQTAVCINFGQDDAEFAERLSNDLAQNGVPAWSERITDPDSDVWALGVHPALEACSHMVVLLSPSAIESEEVSWAWKFFREKRKPVLIAYIADCEVPDELRHLPRFDFMSDYRAAFRLLIQAVSG
jgi:hypothetical protein